LYIFIDYAEGYIKKMRERLDSESFDLAIKLLASFSEADDSNINELYQHITEVLSDKNEDLIYEFLGFLLPGQALSIGKFTDYLELTRIKEFIRKLQVCCFNNLEYSYIYLFLNLIRFV
jgi:hypothetical protein